MSDLDARLAELAEQAGVDVHWRDANDRPQEVAPPTLRAVLDALGLPCANDGDIDASLERLRREREGTQLPRLLVADAGSPFPSPAASEPRRYRIEDEQGATVVEGTAPADERTLRAPDAPGYYRLLLGNDACTLAVAPARAFGVGDISGAHRPWGVAVQLPSLRRPGDGGIGDFTALEHCARAAAARGADALAISPVHALFAAAPERYSPYAPSSRLFLNPLYADPGRVGGASALRTVTDAHNLRQELAELEWLELIDWPRAGRARITLLRTLFEWSSADSKLTQALGAFRREQGEPLERHARFEALQVHFRAHDVPGGWQAWPAEFHDPTSPAVAAFAREHGREVAFHAFLQWLATRGLADAHRTARESGMAIGLVSDLAVGTDPGGSQAWSHQGELLHGLSVGAPPDLLNRNGQDWGLTTFSPTGLKRSGYAGYLGMLRAALAHAGGVRIDHVLGLKRLWLVPHGFGATEGAYVRYPFEDLLRLLAIESHRNRAVVIGEDLGTVPADFRQRIGAEGVLGIRVLWFERAADRGFIAPMHWSAEAMATTSTHDVATVAGWWSGRDIEWRARAGLAEPGVDEIAGRAIDRGRLWRALCASGAAADAGVIPDENRPPTPEDVLPIAIAAAGHVARAPTPLVVIPAEDLLALPEQPNLPGPTDAVHPNWRRRLPESASMLFDGPVAQACCGAVAAARNAP
ncbi:4-alpha-glucanotransferase [Frateuria terrea]|uniref:4-alpha-glucanotransferase n=1 Tax=Frateuria terrea TaxID=529704 RepID=A0A1H6UQ71_9GAMM|nr:4-alpha-glucanotransferase [Frateuria terrea]SEI90400.1 4-alpha-glucanotransferase [Frateuria terrea]SFP36531.1 4-alpha-glucanotransferase [Frateuria terrea]